MSREDAKLFQPTRVGNLKLSHRIVLAPLGRFRADDAHVPTDIMVDYYAQRASVPGSLLITEATLNAAKAGGYDNVPGIWTDAQVEAWKRVVDAVHAQGSYIFINPGGPYPYVSSSDVARPDKQDATRPRPLTHKEILEYIEIFGQAAYNAVHRAGFDGVEIHGARGHLIDQFLQDTCNKRTDQWGGNIETRSRFALEVMKKIVSVVGEERTSIRLSPISNIQEVNMEHPQPTFAYLVNRIRESYPRFAYLHISDLRIMGIFDSDVHADFSYDFLRAIWKGPSSEKNGSAYLIVGRYTAESALKDAEEKADLIVFGRYYVSNPDLPARIKNNIFLAPYDRSTFYDVGNPEGYNDYPFADKDTEARYEAWKEEREQAAKRVKR